ILHASVSVTLHVDLPSCSGWAGDNYASRLKARAVHVTAGSTTQSITSTAPTPPNQPPSADFSASCTNLQCSFADGSSDPDGRVASWSWRFGDGGTSSSQNPGHTYGSEGTYPVHLKARDEQVASG